MAYDNGDAGLGQGACASSEIKAGASPRALSEAFAKESRASMPDGFAIIDLSHLPGPNGAWSTQLKRLQGFRRQRASRFA